MKTKPKRPNRKRSEWPKYFDGAISVYIANSKTDTGKFWYAEKERWADFCTTGSMVLYCKRLKLRQITRAEAKRLGAGV